LSSVQAKEARLFEKRERQQKRNYSRNNRKLSLCDDSLKEEEEKECTPLECKMKKTRISSREKRKPNEPKKIAPRKKKIFDTLNKEQRRHQEMKFFF
jgi:hypothetical protein